MNLNIEKPQFERLQRRLVHVSDGIRCRVIRGARNSTPRDNINRINIAPGSIIMILGRGPYGNPIRVSYNGMPITIRSHLARQIIVEPID